MRLRYTSLSIEVAGIPGSGTRLAIAAGAEHTVYGGMSLWFIITSALVIYRSLDFHPDAYYYFGIARNLADWGTFTFDGESVTTGFHPLWQLLSTGTYFVFRDMASFHVSILETSTLLFIVGYLLLAQGALRSWISPGAFALVPIPVFVINVSLFQKSGLENSLVFFLPVIDDQGAHGGISQLQYRRGVLHSPTSPGDASPGSPIHGGRYLDQVSPPARRALSRPVGAAEPSSGPVSGGP